MKKPTVHPDAFVAFNATVRGDVRIEEGASIFYGAVLRGDRAPITIGPGSNIQENCVVHVEYDLPVVLGRDVTVGHGAILHGCTVGDETLIGMGAIILNGAKIGRHCLIGVSPSAAPRRSAARSRTRPSRRSARRRHPTAPRRQSAAPTATRRKFEQLDAAAERQATEMKTQRPYPALTITPKGERALVDGHPWVYAGEVTQVPEGTEDGALVDVLSRKGSYLGTGFYNSRSMIRVRLLSRNANDRFDRAFWARRVQYAWDYRKTVMGEEDSRCCRIIFGEADHFPGLTVDRFENVLVAQVLSLGMDRIKPMIFGLLVETLRADGQEIAGVYERNDVALREKEGMEQGKGWYPLPGEPVPDFHETDITENGIRYTVDFENGQKTGFFLDQKYNRLAVAKLARGRTVLDCFTHTGSFALNAARGGAKHVTAVDVSEFAVECARRNAERNGLGDVMECVAANVFDLLPALAQQPVKYDFIILDPPAFTKSRRTTQRAMAGYKEINGGYLATCSCSHFATEELFVKMLHSAAHDAGVQLRQIEARQQCADHPILWGVEETNYLEFFLFQVV